MRRQLLKPLLLGLIGAVANLARVEACRNVTSPPSESTSTPLVDA